MVNKMEKCPVCGQVIPKGESFETHVFRHMESVMTEASTYLKKQAQPGDAKACSIRNKISMIQMAYKAMAYN